MLLHSGTNWAEYFTVFGFVSLGKETNSFTILHLILQNLASVDVGFTEEEEKCTYQIELIYQALV